MASKKLKVKGMVVELWEQSFRVEGMTHTIYVGPHMTKEAVVQLVSSVFISVEKMAIASGKAKVVAKVSSTVAEILGVGK